ncbi:MAG TPA: hypothetical protein VIG40_02550, partial [Tissierellaceae bacterium]
MKRKIIIVLLFIILLILFKLSLIKTERKEIEEYLKIVKDYEFDKVEVSLAQSNPSYPIETKIFEREEDIKEFKNVLKDMTVKERVSEEDQYISDTSDYFFYNKDDFVKLRFNGNDTSRIFIKNKLYYVEYKSKSLYDL